MERIAEWQRRAMAAADVRLLPADHLHITLVFLGNRPAADVVDITSVMRGAVAEHRRPAFQAWRYRETARVGMIQLREDVVPPDSYTGRANALTGQLMRELEARRMYRREYRGWTPHVTVARFRQAPQLTLEPPGLDSFSPTGVVLFRSIASANGSRYEQLQSLEFGD